VLPPLGLRGAGRQTAQRAIALALTDADKPVIRRFHIRGIVNAKSVETRQIIVSAVQIVSFGLVHDPSFGQPEMSLLVPALSKKKVSTNLKQVQHYP
jgi:hypothetical protein